MLTEGFGDVRMAASSAQFLDSFIGRQATLDSFMPERLSARRPEVVINVPTRPSDKPPQANVDATIRVGTNVRLTRGDFAGQAGQIIHLPKTPYSLENGLRLLCVQVQLTTGDTAFVPLANLEVTG
jgi:hypothetical protein